MSISSRSRESRAPTQRRQAARWQRERRRQRQVLAFAVVVFLLVIAIPTYGYYATFVAPPRQVVVSINGVDHTLGEVERLTSGNVAFFASVGREASLGVLPFEMINNLVVEELVRQAASRMGLGVTQDEIDAKIRETFYPTPPEGQQTDLEALELEFRETLLQYFNITQWSESYYREIVRNGILRERIRVLLSDQVPAVEEQVYAHWIVLTENQLVEEVQARIDEGDGFDRLARIYSVYDSYANDDGEVGWVPRGAFPDLDPVLFSLELDTISEPISTSENAIYFVKVTDGPEIREVSDEMREMLKNEAMEQWIVEERAGSDISLRFGSSEYQWVVDKVREKVPLSTS